jgi:hypothetical protein
VLSNRVVAAYYTIRGLELYTAAQDWRISLIWWGELGQNSGQIRAGAVEHARSGLCWTCRESTQPTHKFVPKFHYVKRRFSITSKCRHIYGVLNVDEIKNQLHSFIVLCETNILSLITQSLDNYYPIKTKIYSESVQWFRCRLRLSKHGHKWKTCMTLKKGICWGFRKNLNRALCWYSEHTRRFFRILIRWPFIFIHVRPLGLLFLHPRETRVLQKSMDAVQSSGRDWRRRRRLVSVRLFSSVLAVSRRTETPPFCSILSVIP